MALYLLVTFQPLASALDAALYGVRVSDMQSVDWQPRVLGASRLDLLGGRLLGQANLDTILC